MKHRQLILLAGMFFFFYFLQPRPAAGEGPKIEDSITDEPAIHHTEAVDQSKESAESDEYEESEKEPVAKVYDPLMPYNRFMTQVNDKLYFWALKPTAQGYSKIIPEPVRLAIGRFFDNLFFPARGVNNLLQLKFKQAGIETARFGINTTVGILGFFDPAKIRWNLDAHPEDFGLTLAHYGAGSGIPIVLPFLGPSNLRDAFGDIPDIFLNPLYYVDPNAAAWGLYAEDEINKVSLHIGDYETIRNASLDLYISLRNAYEANRKKQLSE